MLDVKRIVWFLHLMTWYIRHNYLVRACNDVRTPFYVSRTCTTYKNVDVVGIIILSYEDIRFILHKLTVLNTLPYLFNISCSPTYI